MATASKRDTLVPGTVRRAVVVSQVMSSLRYAVRVLG
jgi:hypothetical protein